jgi:hypothetical protein
MAEQLQESEHLDEVQQDEVQLDEVQLESVHLPGSLAPVDPLLISPFEPYAATCMMNASVTVVAGPRGRGKTTKAFDLVERLVGAYAEGGRDDVTTVVFTVVGVGYGHLPVRTAFDAHWLEQQMDQRGPDSSPLILVLDEAVQRGFLQSPTAMRLFTSARHLRMHVLVTLQNVRDLWRQLRPYVDVYMLVNSWNVSVVLHDCFPHADLGLVRDALRALRSYEMLVSIVGSAQVMVYRSIPREHETHVPVHVEPVHVEPVHVEPVHDAPDVPPHP